MSRIETLLAQMTLPEKLGQLTMTAASYAVTGPIIAGDSTESIKDGTIGSLLNMIGAGPVHEMQRLAVEQSRLGIPLLVGLDVIHGHRTIFPLPLAEAGTFDPGIWELTAREAALEMAADGLMMTFAPMLDVSRDPRWGRTAEGPGEDPWLNVQIARAKVRGFQGNASSGDLTSPENVAACAKHFVAYGPVLAGREYASVDVSERSLREVHLPAFVAAVEAGVATIMPAFTDLNGVPMTAHVGLLRDYLRGELGFEGVLVSDYNAIGELLKHGVAADIPEAAALALNAGVDIDMMTEAYRRGLPVALERGLVTMEQIDTAVRRVLTLKERLGLFEDPYRRGSRAETPEAVARRRAIARDVGARSIVLLRNEGETLPLSASIPRLCVLGPLADARSQMCGCWAAAGYEGDHSTVLAGLQDALPAAEIRYARGVGISEDDRSGVAQALDFCEGVDAIVLCLGEAHNMSGEAASRAYPELPGLQQEFADLVFERALSFGVPVIVVLFSGRPLVVPSLAARADALLAAWFLGSEAGAAIADVLTGRVSPSARTPITWPRAIGQIPVFFGQRPSGRPENPKDHYTSKYLDVSNEPLFHFGHGLTYGRCVYSNLRVAPEVVGVDDVIEVSVDVTNDGKHACTETVFLFVHDKVASVTRPLLELKGFGKVALEPSGAETVTIRLSVRELRFPGVDLTLALETGDVEILVGPSAHRSHLLSQTIRLVIST